MLVTVIFTKAWADDQYISIIDLKESIPERWTETIQVSKDLTCTIDSQIIVPDVEQFPVLRTTFQGELNINNDEDLIVTMSKSTYAATHVPAGYASRQEGVKTITIYDDQLSVQEKKLDEEKAMYYLEKIWDNSGIELERLGVTITQESDTGDELTSVWFMPIYYGIPVLAHTGSIYVINGISEHPRDTVAVAWHDTGIAGWGITISISKIIDREVSDVPLLPFSEIQDIIRNYIQTGRVKEIVEIRLGYMLFYDEKNLNEEFILSPVWVVCGLTNIQPFVPFHKEENAVQRYSSSKLVINAQTGEIINFTARKKEELYAHFITWEDI